MYNTQIKQRFHAFDNMRAAMMLLGIVFHAGLSYASFTLSVRWGYQDRANSYFLSAMTMLIHTFRMQAFFMIAGFFAALLFHKRGLRGMVADRCKRILKPLIISWPLLFPLSILGAAFPVLGGFVGVSSTVQQFRSGQLLAKYNMGFIDLLTQYGLVHLWFLYYLMIYYTIIAGLITIFGYFPIKVKFLIKDKLYTVVAHPTSILFFVLASALCMYNMPPATAVTAGFDNTATLIPRLPVLLGYFTFFLFGWVLFNTQVLLNAFVARIWLNLSIGLLSTAAYAYLIFLPSFQFQHLAQICLASAATWLLVIAITGWFVKYAGNAHATMRYLAQSSYWVYLVHFPLTTFLPGLFINLAVSAVIKFLLVVLIAFSICILTYHYLVRSTLIGKSLNGRRLPVTTVNTKDEGIAPKLSES